MFRILEVKDSMRYNSAYRKKKVRYSEEESAYRWMVIIGLIVIFFLWTVVATAQSGMEYYKVIATNNLFRPLGWKPPDLTPKFELIGTWISVNTKTKVAYVRNIRTNKIDRLGIGDTINGNVIDNIKQNEVQMNKGGSYESPTMQFLNFSTSRQSSKRSSSSSRGSKNNTNKTTKGKEKETTTSRTSRRSGRTGGANWESQVQRFQDASPEERQKMIEQFRNMRGNGGRRRRRNNG